MQEWGVNKQMRSSEWIALSGAIEKRKYEGKETEVLLNGVPIDAKKLKRELQRYSTYSHVAGWFFPRCPRHLGVEKTPE